MTCLAIAALFGALPRGRYVVASVPSLARQAFAVPLGHSRSPGTRSTNAGAGSAFRGSPTREKALPAIYDEAGPDVQRLMRYAGLDPGSRAAPLGQLRPHAAAPVDDLRGR